MRAIPPGFPRRRPGEVVRRRIGEGRLDFGADYFALDISHKLEGKLADRAEFSPMMPCGPQAMQRRPMRDGCVTGVLLPAISGAADRSPTIRRSRTTFATIEAAAMEGDSASPPITQRIGQSSGGN